MKKILFILLAACCIWAVYDYSRPVDRYVVKTVAGEGDTLWHLVGSVMEREGTAETLERSFTMLGRLATLRAHFSRGTSYSFPLRCADERKEKRPSA